MPNATSEIPSLLNGLFQKTCDLTTEEAAQAIYIKDPSFTQTLALLKKLDGEPEIHWEILTTLKDTFLEHQKPEPNQIPHALESALFELGIHLLLEGPESSTFRETLIIGLIKLIKQERLDRKIQIYQLDLTEQDKEKLKEMSFDDTSDVESFVKEALIKELTARGIDEALEQHDTGLFPSP